MAEFVRPYLYPKQSEAIFCVERWGLTEASTKSGKTVGCIAWLVEQALKGSLGMNYWWIAPVASQADIAFRRMKTGLTRGSFSSYESPTPRIVLPTGSTIWFKSADNPDSLYGEDVYAAVIDEASRQSEGAWHAVRSTLTATRGPCRIIGNVKGRKNWFYDMARKAELGDPSMHYSRITAADAVEAGVLDQAEIDDAKNHLPEKVFRELYFAEPSDDTGNPFGLDHIRACVRKGLAPGPAKAYGVDLAKHQDWFVVIGLNTRGEVCEFHRWQKIPWRESIRRVWQIVGEDVPVLVDSTGVGDPVLEELQHEHGNFVGYLFSPTAKQKLMEGLAVSIQSREVSYPDGFIRKELEVFEYEYTRTGVRYEAAEGHHDDCVCALALARHMWSTAAPGENMLEFYARVAVQAREEAAKAKPEIEEAMPWRITHTISAKEVFDNELTELYSKTLTEASGTKATVCASCGKEVSGPERVTDGFDVWHPACAGPNARRRKAA